MPIGMSCHAFPTSWRAGRPAGTDAANIVQSTLDSTGTAVLPLRTFRNPAVHTWLVATEKEFSVTQFSIEINGHVHQIIIQLLEHPGALKGSGKGSGKNSAKTRKKTEAAPWTTGPLPSKPSAESTRIDSLEARFDRLEQRQTHFEGKVDSKFDSISDALRQLLANTNPRAREASGETPPPKQHKGS